MALAIGCWLLAVGKKTLAQVKKSLSITTSCCCSPLCSLLKRLLGTVGKRSLAQVKTCLASQHLANRHLPIANRHFTFPSNGKAHGHELRSDNSHIELQFQFPSNGKAHGHADWPVRLPAAGFRFNSLQTGKHMGTRSLRALNENAVYSFNSLQTGKHMGTGE